MADCTAFEDPLAGIHRWVRSRLFQLCDLSPERGSLDRARVEHWLDVQLTYLDVQSRPVWADGPLAAWHAVSAEPWQELGRQATWLAEQTAGETVRKAHVFGVRPTLAAVMAAAKAAAQHVGGGGWVAEMLQDSVSAPRIGRRLDGLWRHRWEHRRAAQRRGLQISEAWLTSRPNESIDSHFSHADRSRLGLDEPAGWSGAWMNAWTSKWTEIVQPDADADEKLAILIETVGEEAATTVLQRAHTRLVGIATTRRRDVVYGAWRALAEFAQGPPTTDLEAWRSCMRRYWRPFYEQAAGGLGWCWFTADAVVCLPRPTVSLHGKCVVARWPNGEEIEGPV
jgi:hypothetical protein